METGWLQVQPRSDSLSLFLRGYSDKVDMSLNWFLECLAKFMVKGEGYPGSEVTGDSAF